MSRLAVTLLALVSTVSADIIFENEEIKVDEVFDLKYALNSGVLKNVRNATKYYCVFRSLWTPEDHPNHYPKLARYTTPVLFSHTKQYTPFLKNREANYGLEIIAEVSLYETTNRKWPRLDSPFLILTPGVSSMEI